MIATSKKPATEVKPGEKPPDIQFGIDWSKLPPSMPLHRRFYCCRYNVGDTPLVIHRYEIIKSLWKCSEPGEVVNDADFAWHAWNKKRLSRFSDHSWCTWAGPGGSGKSSDAALFAMQWWLEAPHESAVIVCSTTKELLRKRVWAQLAHFHERLYARFGALARKNSIFGELIDSETKIRWRKGDDKNCIFGMAVGDGPVEEAINNLIGIHTTRVFLILDEMQGVRTPIVSTKVLGNIAKNPVAKFLGMGNPESLNDPLGIHSEPLSGWGSITLGETEQWETRGGPFKGNGICLAFDGRKSPADASPEEHRRLPWLINREWVKEHLDSVNGNDKDPGFLSQAVGIWPMAGLDSTVLDEATILKFHCKEKAVWTSRPTPCAGFDPSFEGRDQAILQFGKRGVTEIDGQSRWMLDASESVRITVNADSEEPVHYQIVRSVRDECQNRKIPPHELALDSTGEGGGLLAIFQREWGQVIGVEFGGRATDMPVSESNPKPGYEEYDRRASELNMAVRTFAINDSLRGLSNEVCQQACARKTEYKSKRYRVETKPDFKKRMGRSPDNLDALAVLIDLCRQKGMSPSRPKNSARPDVQRMAERAQEEFESGYSVNEYT